MHTSFKKFPTSLFLVFGIFVSTFGAIDRLTRDDIDTKDFDLHNDFITSDIMGSLHPELNDLHLVDSHNAAHNYMGATIVGLDSPDTLWKFGGKLIQESYFTKNRYYLNNANKEDQEVYFRHTFDFTFGLKHGQGFCSAGPAVEMFFDARNRSLWANPEGVSSTTVTEIKLLESVGEPHSHFIPRHIFWMRQAWLELDLGTALNLSFRNRHTLKLGAFPFQLGRGISLGDAYRVGPESLGYTSKDIIDQYAFGAKLSGNLSQNLSYDLYTALLDNKSGSFKQNGAKIYGQQYGKLRSPERGFGHINYLFAARSKIKLPFDCYGSALIEPYIMYNSNPEQKIVFEADAKAELTTIGLALEYESSVLEFGFDTAFNLGRQQVHGWDFNQIVKENRGGVVTLVNDKVIAVTLNPDGTILQNFGKVPYAPDTTQAPNPTQRIIQSAEQSQAQNGRTIGVIPGQFNLISSRQLALVDPTGAPIVGASTNLTLLDTLSGDQIVLRNASDRFRDPFSSKFEGAMFVGDIALKLWSDCFKIAATAGYASGDDRAIQDGTFSGFIPLQEAYSGKRVQSAFLLSGASKLNQIFSTPRLSPAFTTEDEEENEFDLTLNGFTNMKFVGGGFTFAPGSSCRNLSINPNVLSYWQYKAIGGVHTHLGTEVNVFANWDLIYDVNMFVVGSLFFPGQHYTDISGASISVDREAILDQKDRTGFTKDTFPKLGDDISMTLNIGLKYSF